MYTLIWSQSIAAGATFNPLTDWQYETPTFPAVVEVLDRATATGLVRALTSGSETIVQECPVQAGGTAGTTPGRQNTEPLTGHGLAAQKLRVAYRNPTAGAITVDGVIIVTPSHGRAGLSTATHMIGAGRSISTTRAPARRAPRRMVPAGFGGLQRYRRRGR